MSRTPIIVVTGAIASGKSTVAEVMADAGGILLHADSLAHGALEDKEVIEKIRAEFGESAMSAPDRISRGGLGRLVLGEPRQMEKLNRIVTPAVTGIIERAVTDAAREAGYIVLDAVLFFKYTFQFRADIVIATEASEQVRVERLMARDGLGRKQALARVTSQRYLYPGWKKSDMIMDTEMEIEELTERAIEIRDRILEEILKEGSGGYNG
mgnify:CR=1 FL=1